MSSILSGHVFAAAILLCFAGASTASAQKIGWSYSLGLQELDVAVCMTECAKHWESNTYRCNISWTEWDYCDADDSSETFEIDAEKTFDGQYCTSLCGYFDYKSEWCYVESGSWDLCSTNHVMVSFADTDQLCMTDCLPSSPKSKDHKCKTSWKVYEKCTPQSLFIETAVTKGKKRCSSHCGKFGFAFFWCEAEGSWDKCYDRDSSYLRLNKVLDSNVSKADDLVDGAKNLVQDDFFMPPLLSTNRWKKQECTISMTPGCPLSDRLLMRPKFVENFISFIGKLGVHTNVVKRNGTEFLTIQYSVINGIVIVHSMQAKLTPGPRISNTTTSKRANSNNSSMNQHMSDHGARFNDIKGHILARRFGGPNQFYNVVPQSIVFNRGTTGGRISRWAQKRNEVAKTLERMRNTDGFISWNIAISYDPRTYRPLKYVQQHSNHWADGYVEVIPDELMFDF